MAESAGHKLYWLGNAAKTKILGEILNRIGSENKVSIFDYGCGTAWGWEEVLRDNPGISLIGFEPHGPSLSKAREYLAGLNARLIGSEELEKGGFKSDYIVSFSVFEHVFDREKYLRIAKLHLAQGGRFYLNYDDGHFRNQLDLGSTATWRRELREWRVNILAALRARLGRLDRYQKRVVRSEVDVMVKAGGFRIMDAVYGNLTSMKVLYRTIPADRRELFARFWLEMESRLNNDFLEGGGLEMGDTANLWRFMVSRTLTLEHA